MPKRNPAITVALIAGAFAIVAPIVTYFVTRTADTYLFQPIPNDRRVAIEGRWTGTIEQEFRGHHVAYPCELQLEVHGSTLRGTLHESMKDGSETFEATFDMTGGFYHDRFTRLEYAAKSKSSIHFGSMILELSPDATTLKGNFVAFGAYSQ